MAVHTDKRGGLLSAAVSSHGDMAPAGDNTTGPHQPKPRSERMRDVEVFRTTGA